MRQAFDERDAEPGVARRDAAREGEPGEARRRAARDGREARARGIVLAVERLSARLFAAGAIRPQAGEVRRWSGSVRRGLGRRRVAVRMVRDAGNRRVPRRPAAPGRASPRRR